MRSVLGLAVMVASAFALTACSSAGAPAPTVPELTYAGAPDDVAPTGPTFTPTTSPSETASSDDADAPAANPAIDDVLQYAAVGGSEITGEWRGGCRMNDPVGVAGMTWRGSDLHVADGRVIADITVEITIGSTAGDGTPNVDHFRVHGAFADGVVFDSNWAPYAKDGNVEGASAEGVYTFHHTTHDVISSFDLRVYCN